MNRQVLFAGCFLVLLAALLITPVPGAQQPAISHFVLLGKYPGYGDLVSVSFPADGSVLVTATSNGTVFFLNRTGRLLSANRTGGPIGTMALSTDGSLAVAGSSDGSVYAYNGTGSPVWRMNMTGDRWWSPISHVAVSSDGNRVAVTLQNGALVLLSGDGALLWKRMELDNATWLPDDGRYTPTIFSLSLSSDGSLIGIASGSGQAYGLNSRGQTRWNYPMTDFVPHDYPVAIAVSNDGTAVAGAGTGKILYLVNFDGPLRWKYRSPGGPPGILQRVAISATGDTVATGTNNGGESDRLSVLDGSGRLLWDRVTGCCGVWSLGMSSDGSIIAAAADYSHVLVFNRTGSVLLDYEAGGSRIQDLSVSADGSTVAAGTMNGTILLFGKVPGSLPATPTPVPLSPEETVVIWTPGPAEVTPPPSLFPSTTPPATPVPMGMAPRLPPYAFPVMAGYAGLGIVALLFVVYSRK
jgi:WD40 repeat protein